MPLKISELTNNDAKAKKTVHNKRIANVTIFVITILKRRRNITETLRDF